MAKDSPALASRNRPPDELTLPNVRLHGPVDDGMLCSWLEQTASLHGGGAHLVLELSTTGGDAEVGRRIADDVRLFRKSGVVTRFFGKTMIYSAGATIMGGFLNSDRWLSQDAVVMVHGRKLSKCLNFDGPLRTERPTVEALLAEIDDGIRIERSEFAKFIEGSRVTLEQIDEKTVGDWYLTAQDALDLDLIAGVV